MNQLNSDINQRLDWSHNPHLASLPLVGADDLRGGMRNLAAAVNLITTRDGDTRLGLTATAVCSVTAEPPRLVVFVNKKVAAADAIMNSGALCVNVLSGEQEHEARVFAGMVEGVQGEARFEHGQWSELVTGAPVLLGALTSFDCRVVKVFDESTHHAFLCEVLATGEPGQGDALLYLNGAFRRLASQS